MANVPLTVWLEWKEQCAAALCCADTQGRLHRFAFSRARRLIDRYAYLTGARDGRGLLSDLTPKTAWHYLESFGVIRESRTGKRYKDWLVSRASGARGASADVIEGGVVVLLRDALRSRLRREHAAANTRSFDQPLTQGEHSVSLAELLPGGPDPTAQLAETEYRDLARRHACDTFADMTNRERVAAVARALGLSFALPVVEKAAGCRKTTLSLAYRECVLDIGRRLKKRHSDDGSEAVLSLTLMTVHAIQDEAVTWAKSEKSCAGLFKEVEAGRGTARRQCRE